MSLLAALSAGGEEKLYVDDVFSAYTYTGNGSTQTINNGIDLAGKGGLVWTKRRSSANSHILTDTNRGSSKYLQTNTTDGEGTDVNYTNSFNSNGVTLGSNYNLGDTNIAWTFRKAPKFFDIVTYTGDGTSNRQIAHSLGCDVGMVITKITSTTGDWNTYHRSATGDLVLNTTAAQTGSHAIVTAADASTFTVTGVANTNGATYVAYLFAHDTSTDGIIQCGSFNANGGVQDITLGWEAQFLMIVPAAVGGYGTFMIDSTRGMSVGGVDAWLKANSANAESNNNFVCPTSTGFRDEGGLPVDSNTLYLVIRRPNKPPTTGTQVYNAIARTGTGSATTVTGVGFAPDLVLINTYYRNTLDFNRLIGANNFRRTTGTSADTSTTDTLTGFDVMDGFRLGADTSGDWGVNGSGYANIYNWCFRRAVGVFDEVCYTGTGSSTTVAHGLGVVPELMIVKNRTSATSWFVQPNVTQYLKLETVAAITATGGSIITAANSSTVSLSIDGGQGFNATGNNYVLYLFASKAGISKVGSYTGNGSSQTIDCGFTTGARFVLIKRTDSTGDWYVWDTVRGIVAGNDPHLSLNTTAAEVTTDDSIDPDSTGFIVNQLAATNINVNAATYIYLAFA